MERVRSFPRKVAFHLGGCLVSDGTWEIWAARTTGGEGRGQATKSDSHIRSIDESNPVTDGRSRVDFNQEKRNRGCSL
jgi:hypothetical protein